MITAVIGLSGSGKTAWIREQIAKNNVPTWYFSPKTETFPIDATCLASEIPNLAILSVGEENKLLAAAEELAIYLEIPWYIDLSAIEPLLQKLNCHRVAVIPTALQNTGYSAWADEVIPGNSVNTDLFNGKTQIHRGTLTGEVLDFASLETFWYELEKGAYGKVVRAKGIFELADGQCIYGDFLKNSLNESFQALNVPRWLDGRPQRFSGIEIVGCNLEKELISETLSDCTLPENAIAHYQQQVKESLSIEEEINA